MVGSAHVIALFALFIVGLELFVLIVCVLTVMLSMAIAIRHFFHCSPGERVAGLSWFPDRKRLSFYLENGESLTVAELHQRALIPGMIVLKFVPDNRYLPIWLIVTADQLDAAAWRRLCIVLKWAPPVQRDASGQG
ncbi:MAG: hypothetical protein GYB21_10585 [Oceanospirillales bacterium]|nr:hypothetical protein [Oceanospirillales bacterium]